MSSLGLAWEFPEPKILCDELPLVGAKRANENQVLIVNSCRFRPATNSQVAGSGEKQIVCVVKKRAGFNFSSRRIE